MHISARPSHARPAAPPTRLQSMLAAIAHAASGGAEGRDRQVAAALADHVADPALLAGIACPEGEARYTRHLLQDNAALGYAVLAIVWRPGQMSPVHGHRAWCAFGVHRGCLVESFFRLKGELPVQARCLQRGAGAVSHAPADPAAIHRLANLGTGTAVSIHVYGAAFDRVGEAVNRVWAA